MANLPYDFVNTGYRRPTPAVSTGESSGRSIRSQRTTLNQSDVASYHTAPGWSGIGAFDLQEYRYLSN